MYSAISINQNITPPNSAPVFGSAMAVIEDGTPSPNTPSTNGGLNKLLKKKSRVSPINPLKRRLKPKPADKLSMFSAASVRESTLMQAVAPNLGRNCESIENMSEKEIGRTYKKTSVGAFHEHTMGAAPMSAVDAKRINKEAKKEGAKLTQAKLKAKRRENSCFGCLFPRSDYEDMF